MTLPNKKEDKMITEYYKDLYKDLYNNYKTPDFCYVCGGFALFIVSYKIVIMIVV